MINVRNNLIPLNGIRLCINEVRNGEAWGYVYSQLLDETISFFGWMDMVMQMDRVFDRLNYPQAFEEKRSFSPKINTSLVYRGMPSIKMKAIEIEKKFGALGTLEIQIQSRRRANWQGVVLRIEEHNKKELIEVFSSEMELFEVLNKQLDKLLFCI